MPKRVTGVTFDRATFVKRGAVRNPDKPSEPFGRLIWKAEDDPASTIPKGGDMTVAEHEAALAKADQEHKAALAKAEQERDEALAKASTKDDDADDDEKKDKSGRNSKGQFEKSELPEAARVAFEKQESELAVLRKSADEAQEIAKAERTLRVEREFIAKAEQEFSHLGKAEELGPRLMKLQAALSKEEYDAHVRELAAANEQIAKGDVFREMGRAGHRNGEGDGYAQALAKAEEIRKAEPEVLQSEAMARAMRDPSIQKAYAAATR